MGTGAIPATLHCAHRGVGHTRLLRLLGPAGLGRPFSNPGERRVGLFPAPASISIEAGKLVLVDQAFDPRRMLQSVEKIAPARAEAKDSAE